ncbi:DMT family transporter [Sediminibacterium sp.]|uniref:DMT family transporter n=1 Tax=Sediminibacterium sp. TaxID=1917865 RepID=UPI002737512D|nr:DMT family transporter [Sediminibacterium sp.]MDP3392794.1 DMT family transporter [Sediminibacterium sp.]MDP3565916.1 DMT family transporter [Sediminibacterium sp.]
MNGSKRSSLFLSGFLLSIGGAILFSTKAIWVKLAFRNTGVDALTLLSLRMLLALPFYLVVAWFSGKKESAIPLSKKDWFWIITLGVLGYYISSLFDFIGLQYISAGLERLILFLYPTFAVLLNTWVFKSTISKIQLFALAITYTGIGIAYYAELGTIQHNEHFYFGSFMVFLCAVTYSFYLVGTGKMVVKVGATRYTAYAMLAATAGVFIHFITQAQWEKVNMSSQLWWYSIALAIIATVIPSFLMSSGMKKIGSNNASIITSIGPVSTIIQAAIFLNEPILMEQIVGTFLVIIGVVLIGWQTTRPIN